VCACELLVSGSGQRMEGDIEIRGELVHRLAFAKHVDFLYICMHSMSANLATKSWFDSMRTLCIADLCQ
jgi:hypothetical protein